MKKIILAGLFMFVFHAAAGQELMLTTGLSLHTLEDLKASPAYLYDYPVELEETQSFPPYLQYGFAMRFPLSYSKITLGGNLYMTSTAARSTYEDYSGMFQINQRLSCLGLGFTFTYTVQEYAKAKVNLYASVGAELSTLKTEVLLRLFNQSDNEKNTYNAISPMSEVGLEYQYSLSQKFFLHGSGALHISQKAMLINTEDDSEFRYVNWTGGKFLVGIGCKL
jgi:hypothetical protein